MSKWQTMDMAPGDEDTPVLLWIAGQCAIGITWAKRDGTIIGKASMFGNQHARYWMPLPEPPSGVSSPPEHAVAIPSHGTAAGEGATSNASVASPLSHSDREV